MSEDKVDLSQGVPDLVMVEDLGLLYPTPLSKSKKRYGLYICGICGTTFKALQGDVNRKSTQSCGCLQKIRTAERNKIIKTKHLECCTRLYRIWSGMKDRCNNPNSKDAHNYSLQGITICKEWDENFETFRDWAYNNGYKENLSIDRKEPTDGYTPTNCRWADKVTQSRNTKCLIRTNTSGYRGVGVRGKHRDKWYARIRIGDGKRKDLGTYNTALEAAKAYQKYIILNDLEHNPVPVLSEEEIQEILKEKDTYALQL